MPMPNTEHQLPMPVEARFFADVAERIARDLGPASVLDVGSPSGMLADALVERGIDAHRGAALTPLDRRYDLVTCIAVVETMPPADAERVVQAITDHTDDVLFASDPYDHRREANVNVNPPEHWAELFARCGFLRDLTYDTAYIAPWAMRFRRSRDSLPRRVRDYERELWQLRNEARQRTELVAAQVRELEALRRAQSTAEAVRLAAEVDRLSEELTTQNRLLADVSAKLRAQTEEFRVWRDSGAGRIAQALQRGGRRVAPEGTRRQHSLHRMVVAGKILGAKGPSGLRQALRERRQAASRDPVQWVQTQYDEWRRRNEPGWADLNQMRNENRTWTERPLISVLMPTYNPEPDWIQPAVDSVIGQVYENWELCIADDASTAPHVHEILAAYAASDPRIKVVSRPRNGGIAAATQSALEIASGGFVALLDHDDVLRPHALHRVVERIREAPDMDIVYSDEDLLLRDGTFGQPFFKPDFSPDFLLSVNYICHFLVVRRALVHETGGFRGGFDGAQDHDLLLRTTEKARRIAHVPDILYSWRQVPGSVAMDSEAKMYAFDSGKRAVEDALVRRGLPGQVTLGEQLGTYHVRLEVIGNPHVAIVIPTRDRLDLLRECIDSIEKRSTYTNWSITIVDNDSARQETLEFLRTTRHRVVRHPGEFNYSALINTGRAAVDAPYILTVNNDTTVISPDWIEAMLEQTQRHEVAVTGGRLLYPDGRPQSEGIAVGNVRGGYMAANMDAGWQGRVIRNVTAVSGACQMITTSVFDELGGYDVTLGISYNDVDFCLRARRAGHLVIYTPHAELQHHESASRGAIDPVTDHQVFWERWGVTGGIPDPYMNPNLRDLNPLVIKLDPMPLDH
jgi:GT2 family glycosyltransferase